VFEKANSVRIKWKVEKFLAVLRALWQTSRIGEPISKDVTNTVVAITRSDTLRHTCCSRYSVKIFEASLVLFHRNLN
jgi:hypothetical protein